ncbi:MAG TPA: DUF3662 and FHA domain-containing protein [Candidatus Limnocylindrales bacterium]|nr:DUF3662 and FHA domain-containing protein [Candidatus Limnocylindrales bacterium]
MSALAELERFLERLFERTTARVFRTRVRPVQLQRRIERAMELGRVPGADRPVVPDRYRLRLHPDDVAGLAADGGPAGVAARLADSTLAFARAHAFQVLDRPSVTIAADPSVELGSIEVETGFARARSGAAGVAGALPDRQPGAERSDPAASGSPLAPGSPAVADGVEGQDVEDPNDRGGDLARTMVYRRPIVPGPLAVLRVVDRAGAERTIEIDGSPLTIGRSHDNALVVDDVRVSRHHARLQARRGSLVFTDLGSTNGSRVNGLAVDEIVLGLGDRIELGDTTLVVESLPG